MTKSTLGIVDDAALCVAIDHSIAVGHLLVLTPETLACLAELADPLPPVEDQP